MAAAIAASLAESKSQPRIPMSDLDEDYVGSNDETSDFSGLDVSDDNEIIIDDSDSKDSSPKLANSTQKPENIVNNSPINQTKVDENFFSQAESQKSKLQNGKSKSSNNLDDKLYKKIHKKLKIGSVPNGKDMTSLTTDKYSFQSNSNKPTVVKPEDLCRIMIRYPDGTREEIAMDVNLTVEVRVKLQASAFHSFVRHYKKCHVFELGPILPSLPLESLQSLSINTAMPTDFLAARRTGYWAGDQTTKKVMSPQLMPRRFSRSSVTAEVHFSARQDFGQICLSHTRPNFNFSRGFFSYAVLDSHSRLAN